MSKVNEAIKQYKKEVNTLNKEQKDQIIMEYAPVVKTVAQRIAMRLPNNIDLDDLISAGVIGLMDAVDKYDQTRDNKFKTYAEFRIRGAILDELRAQDWLPRSVREKSKVIEKAIKHLENELGVSPTEVQVADKLNLSIADYRTMLNEVKSISLMSLDEITSSVSSDKRSILNLIESNKVDNPLNELSLRDLKNSLVEEIKNLPEKHRLVLSLYYYEELNLKEIGEVLEITESRVSQIHTEAVLRLRSGLKEFYA